ncbi:hypothetical protein [Pseudomonas typographi]|uniref:hypothetical protein n=1 Tax=Pseudomonas typographi TaxID=2715964 RepID=UPI001688346E|nr:hypothetical protein [Pseudomonas typographi]MBD1554755.1 hypothetical protein [Pseudomonas typographi]
MASRKPLVRDSGGVRQMAAGDAIKLLGPLNQVASGSLTSASGIADLSTVNADTVKLQQSGASISQLGNMPVGTRRRLFISNAVTLAYSSTYIRTPGNADLVLNPGAYVDVEVLSNAGQWYVMGGMTATGTALVGSDSTKLPLAGGKMTGALNFASPVTLADSATPAIGAAASNNIVLNGTTTITGFDTIAAGATRLVKFAAARTLQYQATSFILPGAANITTAAGDMALFRSLGSGYWECVFYQRADGTPLVSAAQRSGRNLLINPLFNVNQRAYTSGAATTAANQYTYDRWKVPTSGQSVSLSGVIATVPAGGLTQIIEGTNLEPGTNTYCVSWTGTATCQVNGTTVANGGTFSAAYGGSVTVTFASGTLSLPKVEVGASATPFYNRSYDEELTAARRYARAVAVRNVTGQLYSATAARFDYIMDTPMRSAPAVSTTMTTSGSFSGDAIGSGQALFTTMSSPQTTVTSVNFDYTGATGSYTANQRIVALDSYFLDAEL